MADEKGSHHCDFKGCTRWFNTLDKLQTHKVTDPDHDYCRPCDKNFADWESYTQHRYADPAHQNDPVKVCPICGAEFRSKGGLGKHISRQHPVRHEITCFGCDTPFASPAAYIAHVEDGMCAHVRRSELQARIEHKITIKNLLDGQTSGQPSTLVSRQGGRAGIAGATGSTIGLSPMPDELDDLPEPVFFDEESTAAATAAEATATATAVGYNGVRLNQEEYPSLAEPVPTRAPKAKKKKKRRNEGPTAVPRMEPPTEEPAQDAGFVPDKPDIQNLVDLKVGNNAGAAPPDNVWARPSAWEAATTAATGEPGVVTRADVEEDEDGREPFRPDMPNLEFLHVHEWAQQIEADMPPPDENPPLDDEDGVGAGPDRPAKVQRARADSIVTSNSSTSPTSGGDAGGDGGGGGGGGGSRFVPAAAPPPIGDAGANQFRLHYWDPDHPKFDPSRLYDRATRTHVCPHAECGTRTVLPDAIREHLRQEHILKVPNRCPECRRGFKTRAALVAHVTSGSARCKIQLRTTYGEHLSILTGGFVSVYESNRTVEEGAGPATEARDAAKVRYGQVNRFLSNKPADLELDDVVGERKKVVRVGRNWA